MQELTFCFFVSWSSSDGLNWLLDLFVAWDESGVLLLKMSVILGVLLFTLDSDIFRHVEVCYMSYTYPG